MGYIVRKIWKIGAFMDNEVTKIFNLNECKLSDRNDVYGGMAGKKKVYYSMTNTGL